MYRPIFHVYPVQSNHSYFQFRISVGLWRETRVDQICFSTSLLFFIFLDNKSSKSSAFKCFLPSRQPCWPSAPSPLELRSSLGRPSHSQRLISSSPFPPSASSWLYGHMSRSCSSPVFGISTPSKGLSSASSVALHPATPVHLSQSQQYHTATVIASWISQENQASTANCLRSFSARWMSS